MEIKVGKFFQNPQKKDGEIKLMRGMTSYMEGIWEKKSDMHILRILEREDEKLKENKQCKKDNILSLRKI